MKLPKLSNLLALKPRRKLHASTAVRRAAPIADHYDDEEPQTRLSSAFIVVLILHVVAVGGIYAFNSIKAHRKAQEPTSSSTSLANSAPSAMPAERAPSIQPAPLPSTVLPAVSPIAATRTHRVVAGDNLTKIAAQYGVTVADLEEANGTKKTATLRVGQVMSIPKVSTAAKSTPSTAATSTPQVTYIVAKDDNPASIARKLHVNYSELLKLNNIEDPKKLQPGQKLKVPAAKKAN
jgi:LysM repeat protein